MLSAIVLAAGRSSRMGAFKQLLPFGDKTVIEQVVTALLDSSVKETIVVLGHRADEVEAQLQGYHLKIVRNPDSDGDMLSSIQCGVRHSVENHGVMIVLGDQPLITSEMIDSLIEFYKHHKDVFVIPVHSDKRGHPMIISPCFRKEMLSLSGTDDLKALRDRHPDAIHRIPVETASLLDDIDYYHEYEDALRRLMEKN